MFHGSEIKSEILTSEIYFRTIRYFYPGWLLTVLGLFYLLRIFYKADSVTSLFSELNELVWVLIAIVIFLGTLIGFVMIGLEIVIRNVLGSRLIISIYRIFFHPELYKFEYIYKNTLMELNRRYKVISESFEKESEFWLKIPDSIRKMLEMRYSMSTLFFNISFITGAFFLFQFTYVLYGIYNNYKYSLFSTWVLIITLSLTVGFSIARMIYSFYKKDKNPFLFVPKDELNIPEDRVFSLIMYIIGLVSIFFMLEFCWYKVFPYIPWWGLIDLILSYILLVLHISAYWAGCRDFHRFINYYCYVKERLEHGTW